VKRLLSTILLILSMSSPAWAHPGFTDTSGCHTDRKWERHCHETVNLAAKAIDPALAKSKESAPDTYDAMYRARVRASGRVPGAYKAMERAKVGTTKTPDAYLAMEEARARAKATGRNPGAYKAMERARGEARAKAKENQ
jgi:hypothetical protein